MRSRLRARLSTAAKPCQIDDDVPTLLHLAYDGLPDGFSIDQTDRDRVHCAGGAVTADGSVGAATYGEVSAQGVETLIDALRLDDTSTFYDLGSGRGAAVLQVALQTRACVRQAVGIELSRERHAIAVQALRRVAVSAPRILGRADFICADLATSDWYRDATEVFCTNLLFGKELDRRLSEQLSRCETLRRVVTLRPVVEEVARVRLVCILKLGPFSWAEQCRVYVYQRRRKAEG